MLYPRSIRFKKKAHRCSQAIYGEILAFYYCRDLSLSSSVLDLVKLKTVDRMSHERPGERQKRKRHFSPHLIHQNISVLNEISPNKSTHS